MTEGSCTETFVNPIGAWPPLLDELELELELELAPAPEPPSPPPHAARHSAARIPGTACSVFIAGERAPAHPG
jgi:hypothetical protein